MKAVVFTLGCKVNSWESSALLSGLKSLGYEVSDKLSYADLYIINTCAVTGEAEKKSRQAIARVKKYNDKARIIVCGCAAQKDPKSFIDKQGVTLVTGALNKDKIIDMLFDEGVKIDDGSEYYERFVALGGIKTRAFIKIQDGCDNFCSYCIIPYLRGRERSRAASSILSELDKTTAKEVVLTGINVSKYSYGGLDLAGLIDNLKNYPFRIRLSSLEDNVVSKRLLSALASLPDFAEHFHLSLQSGSDKVLKEMNRKYDTAFFRSTVSSIREVFPGAAITTDVIAGYSTETEEDFADTLSFCEEMNFADIHCFEYSAREGTAGYKLKQLPEPVKRSRMERLIALKTRLKDAFVERNLGTCQRVLFEENDGGFSSGYTGNYVKAYLPAENATEGMVEVRLISKFKDGALCEVLKKENI